MKEKNRSAGATATVAKTITSILLVVLTVLGTVSPVFAYSPTLTQGEGISPFLTVDNHQPDEDPALGSSEAVIPQVSETKKMVALGASMRARGNGGLPSYHFKNDFSTTTQGPVWYYMCTDGTTWKELEKYDGSYGGRWMLNVDDKFTRVFPNGVMPGGADDEQTAMVWEAPQDGFVRIATDGPIAMEVNREDRDGVHLTILQENNQIWPDEGQVVSTELKKDRVEFDPFIAEVTAGQRLYFSAHRNDDPHNDRVFWIPTIKYVEASVPQMLDPVWEDQGNNTFSFAVENYNGEPMDDIALYASVGGKERTEVPITSAVLENNVVTATFADVVEIGEVAHVQLYCTFAGDSRVLTYEAEGLAGYTVSVSSSAGGTVAPSGQVTVREGGSLSLTITPFEGNGIASIEIDGQGISLDQVVDNVLTLDNITADMELSIMFALEGQLPNTTYYISASQGDDSNDGTSEGTPWKTLEKINNTTFLPGDKILFKSGDVWNGYLWPKGSGTPNNEILISKYGGEAYPILNADRSLPYDYNDLGPVVSEVCAYHPTVFLNNQDYWIIEQLEVTNQNRDRENVGILVMTNGTDGRNYGITVKDCYVHDVITTNPSGTQKFFGGIIGVGSTRWIDRKEVDNPPTSSDNIGWQDLTFENNHVKNVAKEGIRTSGHPTFGPFRNNSVHHNVVVRGNFVEEVFGDGIVMGETSHSAAEYNVIKNHCNTYHGGTNYAGLWAWMGKDLVYRYNEVFGGRYGANDGEAFDFDSGNERVVYEYNFSHHNRGGLLLTMGGQGASWRENTFRYNISVNDGHAAQELFHVQPTHLLIYNNTMYTGPNVSTSIFDGGTANYFKNNIVFSYGDLGIARNSFTAGNDDDGNIGVAGNIFYPMSMMGRNGFSDEVIAENYGFHPQLSSPRLFEQKYEEGYEIDPAPLLAGDYDTYVDQLRERASYFKLTADSPAIGMGLPIADGLDKDFFGNPLPADGSRDIGAHQFTNDPGPEDTDSQEVTGVRLDKVGIVVMVEGFDTLSATVLPITGLDSSVSWTSADESIATVDYNGKVIGISEGDTIIRATSNADPTKFAECKVAVQSNPVDEERIISYKDTFVRTNNSVQPGDEERLQIKNDTTSYARKTLISFDLTNVPNPMTEEVILELYLDTVQKPNTVILTEIEDTWQEGVVKHTTVPPTKGEVGRFTAEIADSRTWKQFDIREFIQEKLDANQTSFSLLLEAETLIGGDSVIYVSSRESDYPPTLLFTDDLLPMMDSIAAVRTGVGLAPELPETVKGTLPDGTEKDYAIVWDTVEEQEYAQEGSFGVQGTLPELHDYRVAITVHVVDYPVAIEEVVVETKAGIAPVLPEQVTATLVSGIEADVYVRWDTIPEGNYHLPGEFTVNGQIDNFEGTVQAKVIVGQADILSVDPVDTYGFAGYLPQLPKQVNVHFTNNTSGLVNVAWETLTLEDYNTPGVITVTGTVAGDVTATATVTLYELSSLTLDPMTNPVGKYPALPQEVTIDLSGDNRKVSFVWETVAEEDYTSGSDFVVHGVVSGTTIPVTISVTTTGAITEQDQTQSTIADTYIQQEPSQDNFGSYDQIYIKNYEGRYKRDGLVKFKMDNPQDLTSLTLRLYVKSVDKKGTEVFPETWMRIYAGTSAWQEDTVNWETMYQGADYKMAVVQDRVTIKASDVGSYLEIDVSKALPYMDADGYITLVLTAEENPADSENGQNSGFEFYSKEGNSGQTPPELVGGNRYVTTVGDLPKKVITTVGQTPELPTQIEVTLSNGETTMATILWDDVSDLLNTPGSYKISGTVEGTYLSVSVEVVVEEPKTPVSGVRLNKAEVQLTEGETQRITATVLPAEADNPSVVWSSSDASVALVDQGVITAKGEGTAVITVTTVDGNFTAHCTVTVKKAGTSPEPIPPVRPSRPSTTSETATGKIRKDTAPVYRYDQPLPFTTKDLVRMIRQQITDNTKAGAADTAIKIRRLSVVDSATWEAVQAIEQLPEKLHADTLLPNGKAVDVRITLAPDAVTEALHLGGFTGSATAESVKELFQRFFSNALATIDLKQDGSFGQTVKVATRVELGDANVDNLMFYCYDNTTNTYKQLQDTKASLDSNGYLHFYTEFGGTIVISDGPLAK